MESMLTSLTLKIKQAVSQQLWQLGMRANELAKRIYRPPQELRVIPWFKDNGDQTLRQDYPLTADSVVFDLGGYRGQWASDIFSRYCCWILVFEAHPRYASLIQQRFQNNPKVQVYPLGLGNKTEQATIGSMDDSSSLFKSNSNGVPAKFVRAADFIAEHKIDNIDLMKINIEGAEYDLLEHLLETGLISKIRNLQVQFHDFVPNAVERMLSIQQQLSQTHQLTYQYEFVWENWEAKEIKPKAFV